MQGRFVPYFLAFSIILNIKFLEWFLKYLVKPLTPGVHKIVIHHWVHCPNTEFFLARIFPYSDWIWRFTEKIRTRENSVFGHISRSAYLTHKRLTTWLFDEWLRPVKTCLHIRPPPEDVNWTCIRLSEDVRDVFWMSYLLSLYILCPEGRGFTKWLKTLKQTVTFPIETLLTEFRSV